MIAYQAVNRARIENTRGSHVLPGECVQQETAQRPSEPVVRRNIETGLSPLQNGRGQFAAHELLEEKLLREATNFEGRGQRSRKLHDPVIEEGRPHLQ